MDDLKKTFDTDRFTGDDSERILHSHGQHSTDEVYKVLYNKLEKFADLVFYIETQEETEQLIALAKTQCLSIPYGGGTNVTNALRPPKDETRMIVSVDTRRMNVIESLDQENLLVTVQAGITGKLETQLNERALRLVMNRTVMSFLRLGLDIN